MNNKLMDLNEIAIFTKVVEVGSFAGAAELLDMPKSTVSSKVSALEKRLGVTLIRRTTRKLFVTDAGLAYHKQCLQALHQIALANEQVTQTQAIPQGVLRITAPVELGGTLLPLIIEQFQKLYPAVSLDVILSDRAVDLVAEGVDVAIRAGELKDSSLIAKKIGSVYFAPFASPKYIKAHGIPKSPKELQEHSCIQFSALDGEGWKLQSTKGSQMVNLNKKMTMNDLNLIKQLAIAGMGIALMPTFFCYYETKTKKLVRILDDWRSEIRPVHFVYPQQEFISKKLSAFLQVATKIIRESLETFNF
ncbi:MAG: LysR family transcriptional regulator [Bdellovibrio sp.]